MTDDLTPILHRIRRHIHKHGDCWIWTAACTDGRGVIRIAGHLERVHRILWQLQHGALPPGLELWHVCPQPGCVNPAHHEPRHRSENYTNVEPCNSLTSSVTC